MRASPRCIPPPGWRAATALSFFLLATASLAGPAQAQTAGATQDTDQDHVFTSTGQPMWGPSQPADFSVRFFDLFFDTGTKSGSASWYSPNTDLGEYGIGLSGGGRVAFGISAGAEFTAGRVDVAYPIRLKLTYPEDNSFRDGEEIRILTSAERLTGGTITSEEPFASVDITGRIGFHANAGIDICVIACGDGAALGPIEYPGGFSTVAESEAAAKAAADQVQLFYLDSSTKAIIPSNRPPFLISEQPLPHQFTVLETVVSGLSGAVDVPHLSIPCPAGAIGCSWDVSPRGANGLLGKVTHPFIDMSLDVDTWWTKFTKIPLGVTVPFDGIPTVPTGARAQADAIDLQIPLKVSETQEFELTANPDVTLTFPVPIDFRVVEGNPESPVSAGTGATEINFKVGQTLYVVFPEGMKTPMDAGSGFEFKNRFENRTSFSIESDYVTRIGFAEFVIPEWEVFPAADVCYETTVTLDPLDVWPDESCPTPALVAPAVDESAGPWFEAPIKLVNESFSIPVAPWELQGFTPFEGTSITLDPENPLIGVTASVVSGLASMTGPAGTLVQTLVVTNDGDVDLLTSQVLDDLSSAFPALPGFSANSVKSLTLTTNGAFDGVVDLTTLSGSETLAVGQAATIVVEIAAEPGNIYNADVLARGVSPIGTTVEAGASTTFAVYATNIDTDKLNGPGGRNSRVPVHFLDTPALPVADIDPESIRIDGVAPLNWTYVLREDVGPELDLALQFDRGEVWDRVQARAAAALAAPVSALEVNGVSTPQQLALLADALLSGASADAELATTADRRGNANGRLDVGDLRAAIVARTPQGPDLQVLSAKAEGISVVVPITGALHDGTAFMGEDAIIIPALEN